MGTLRQFIPMGIDEPGVLLLLLIFVPLILLIGFRSLSGLGKARRSLAMTLRAVLFFVLVLMLGGAHHLKFVNDRVVVFVLDKSKSVPIALQESALNYIKQSAAAMRPGKDRVGVITFDGKTSIEQLVAHSMKVDGISPNLDPSESNIAGALRMAAALVPGDESARIIVLSDGNETTGSAESEAQTLASLSTPIDVVPLDFDHESEVVFERLDVPASARINETVGLNMVMRSQQRVDGRVRVFHGENEIQYSEEDGKPGFPVALQPGVNRMTLPVKLTENGVHRFTATFEPNSLADDVIPGNNRGQSFTRVGGKDRVLIIGNDDSSGEGSEFRSMQVISEALAAQGIESDVVEAKLAQLDSASLYQYATVILSNVSAIDLGDEGDAALASYTRDLGGGLIVLGGDQSFSVGGYYDTALEDILPVETNRRKLVTLNLGLVLVIDRSGSMVGQKLDLAKQAAAASAKLLSSMDRIGVLAFDGIFEWVVPIRPANNKEVILKRIKRIGPGGGTDMYPPMVEAINMLKSAPVGLRHIIMLTDGQSMPGDFEGAAKDALKKGITITTICIGTDADNALLKSIAKTAGGRSYVAADGRPLPRIFARETILAGRSSLQEKRFTPTVRPELDDLFVKGLVSEGLPPLDGYVVTIPKSTARVLMVAHTEQGDDPILAHWQVGLGRAIAFTSGMWPKWGREWIGWPAFSQFWTQIVRWSSRSFGQQDAMVWTRVEGRSATITVELEQGANPAVMPAALTAQIVNPNYSVTPIVLKPVGAGRFEAAFDVSAAGSYVVNVFHQGRDLSSLVRAGVTVPYSPEFAETHSNTALLRRLAEETNGRVLAPTEPAMAFDADAFGEFRSRRPMQKELLIIAMTLLIVDVAARRIAIRKADIMEWIARRFGRQRVVAAADQKVTMSALRDARGRAKADIAQPAMKSMPQTSTPELIELTKPPSAAESSTPPRTLPKKFVVPTVPPIDLNATGTSQPARTAGPAEKPTAKPADETQEATTARLLSIKRKRNQ